MKILHTADIHIGYETHGRHDTKSGLNSRWLDTQKCLKFMVQKALEEDIDLFLFCGDAYKDSLPTPTEQRIFARALRPLLDKGIPTVFIVGNHDYPVAAGKANALQIFPDLHDKVYLFSNPRHHDFETKSGKIRIIGLPWPMRNMLAGQKEYLNKTSEELNALMHEIYADFIESEAEKIRNENLPYPAILAAHVHVADAIISEGSERISSRDPMFNVAVLAKREFSYVALGHIHKHQDLNEGAVERGEPPVVYSGSIERITFSEEKDPKGFVIVELDEHKRATYRHVQTPARPMQTIKIDIREKADNEVMQEVQKTLNRYNTTDAIVRINIECRKNQQRLVDFAEIKKLLSCFNLLPIQFKVHQEESVEDSRRRAIARASTMREAFSRYIDAREDLVPKKDKLLAKFDELERKLDRVV
ncbi:MAG: exonuclease SbcCD subunit D [Candidatus Thermochlorobacter sp.]